MKLRVLIASLALAIAASGCGTAPSTRIYAGTRGRIPAGEPLNGAGIWSARFDRKTGALSEPRLEVEMRGASWLVADPVSPVLYSVGTPSDVKDASSNLFSFQIDPVTGQLAPLASVPSGGHDTTHLALDASSATVFGAAYGGAEVTAAPLLGGGRIGAVAAVQKNVGTGPHPRQAAPHAHGVALDPSGRYLLSTDLGADRIFVYRFDGKNRTLSAAEAAYEATAPGSGPRHLVFHPNGHLLFVITELTAEVWVYRWDPTAGRLHFVSRTSAYPSDYAGSNRSGSELLLSHDGRFLYVALRGDQNSVVTYAVDPQSGALREQQRIAAQGLQPWGMALDRSGHWMLVANTGSGTVDVLAVNTHSGLLSPTHQSVGIPDVAAVTFADR